jgi:hypothetical protein
VILNIDRKIDLEVLFENIIVTNCTYCQMATLNNTLGEHNKKYSKTTKTF